MKEKAWEEKRRQRRHPSTFGNDAGRAHARPDLRRGDPCGALRSGARSEKLGLPPLFTCAEAPTSTLGFTHSLAATGSLAGAAEDGKMTLRRQR